MSLLFSLAPWRVCFFGSFPYSSFAKLILLSWMCLCALEGRTLAITICFDVSMQMVDGRKKKGKEDLLSPKIGATL